MLEELSRAEFVHGCRMVAFKAPLVKLKDKPWKQVNEFENFFVRKDSEFNFNFVPVQMMSGKGRRNREHQKAWLWFNENSARLFNAYIRQQYGGDAARAMREAGTFGVFFDRYKMYFDIRRKMFMEKTNLALAEKNVALAKAGKTPQSHGGVANLLKVLTKTMHEQGSGIDTIARVQYAVCMQAGIYIPDEFLTDVLVASEIIGG